MLLEFTIAPTISDGLQDKDGKMRIKVLLEASDEGGYTVYVAALAGCISEGETSEDALINIREAIELYLEPVEDDWVLNEDVAVEEIEL
jgi:predicted RNase H-like HicB family nuclease